MESVSNSKESTSIQVGKSKRYQFFKRRLFFVYLVVDILLLMILLTSGLSEALKNFATSVFTSVIVTNGIYILIFVLGMFILHFPLKFLEGFYWEHKFALSNQKFTGWLKDELKGLFISSLVTLCAIEVVYIFIGRFPHTWWIGAAFFWLFLSLFLARLMPNVIIPLFYKYSEIDNALLKERILKLFERSHLKIKNAYAINFSAKTKKVNALICGLGNNRRVILADNLINQFTIDEIETVVAHEIAHYKNHDILRLSAVNFIATFFSFYCVDKLLKQSLSTFGFSRLDDIAFFPMMALAFVVLGFVIMPLMNAYSRRIETRADADSLKLTQKPNDLISAFKKLGEMNLSDFEPDRITEILFYDHPPLSKRIKFAERFFST